jgi:Ca2+-binding EF-hand superfamily protein
MGGQEAKIKSIPMGDSPQERENRQVIFSQFDMNSNGYLSLAEVDKGVRDVLNLPELFELKPVLIRAFTAAKTKLKTKNSHGDDYVSKAEFRYLLIYLRQYYTLWQEFEKIEVNGDRRVSVTEFNNGAPFLQKAMGIRIKNPTETFQQLLKKHNEVSHITFTDFCDWAIAEHFKLHSDRDDHNDL